MPLAILTVGKAKDFYKKLGYTEIGEIYKEEFCPHIKMFKDLK